MAVNYNLPPWLTQHADPAAEYNASMRQATALSAQMAMQQQRLSEEAAQAAQAASARAEQAQKENDLRQQEIQISKARYDAEAGLRRQQLQTAQDRVAMSAQAAARKYQAQQAFQAEIGDGSDPEKVTRAMLKYGAAMGEPGAAMSAAMRAQTAKPAMVPGPVQGQPVLDPVTKAAIPGAIATPSPTGRGMQVHWARGTEGQLSQEDRATLHELDAEEKEIRTDPMFAIHQKRGDDQWKIIDRRLKEISAEKEDLLPRLKKGGTRTGTSGAKEVVRLTKSGRRAVFDADTKKFLRWADSDTTADNAE